MSNNFNYVSPSYVGHGSTPNAFVINGDAKANYNTPRTSSVAQNKNFLLTRSFNTSSTPSAGNINKLAGGIGGRDNNADVAEGEASSSANAGLPFAGDNNALAGSAALPPNYPHTTLFSQQMLPAWNMHLSPPYVVLIFIFLGVFFVAVGIAAVVSFDQAVEIVLRYDDLQECPFAERSPALRFACSPLNVTFTLKKTITAPIFINYRLKNFHQNHRKYVRSMNSQQLRGDGDQTMKGKSPKEAKSKMKDCVPFRSPGEYTYISPDAEMVSFNDGEKASLTDAVYNPCGLIPWSMFNDSMALYKVTRAGQSVVNEELLCDGENFDDVGNVVNSALAMVCEKRGIAWPSDVALRFNSPFRSINPKNNVNDEDNDDPRILTNVGWRGACDPANASSNPYNAFVCNGWYIGEVGHKIPSSTDEDLMVWMRLSPTKDVRKLYRRITSDLTPGEYSMKIFQRYDVRSFDGTKSFALTSDTWIGGKNILLGVLYLITGTLLIVLGVSFGFKHVVSQRKLFQMK